MTVETFPAPPSRRGRSIAFKFAIAFIVGVVLVAGFGGAGLYAYGQQYTGRVLPGVSVGSTDLSGLAPDQARAAIESAYGSLGAGRIILAGPDGELTIGYGAIGRGPDTEMILGAALAAGRKGEPIPDLIAVPQTALHGATVDPAVTFDPAKLADAVAAAARTVDREPVDATLVIADGGSYQTTPSAEGRVVNQAALVSAISEQVGRLDAPAEIRLDLPFATAAPAVTTETVEAAKAAAGRMTADIVLTRGTDSWTIPSAKLRPLVSFSSDTLGEIVPVVDESGIDPLLKGIEKDLNQKAASATFRLNGSRVEVASASREGRTLDVAATHALIIETMTGRQSGTAGGSLEPVLATVTPGITSEQATDWASKMVRISKWTTWFPIWVRNGYGANIWVPAKFINGYVVSPGETFDFWKVVGPVTVARGFRPGNAIINGHADPLGAMGGGICSCSTTLFNAALRAGFKMGSRRNHFYYINRYPKGLDATVFKSGSSVQNMTWTNDTDYPVLIRGINTRSGSTGFVTFYLYSVPTGRKVVIGAPVVKNFKKASTDTIYTSTLPKGKRVLVEAPEDGFDVWRTITVYEDGKVLRSWTYYSHYGVVIGTLQVGTGGSGGGGGTPSPSPSPTPTP
ncbi:MAG: VanW family protein [Chloroflexota bacterium]